MSDQAETNAESAVHPATLMHIVKMTTFPSRVACHISLGERALYD